MLLRTEENLLSHRVIKYKLELGGDNEIQNAYDFPTSWLPSRHLLELLFKHS